MDGSQCVDPMPGGSPRPTNVMPTLASGAATRRSQAQAMAKPAPMAGPLMAATIGTSSVRSDRKRP